MFFICSCIKIGDNRLIDRLLRCDYARVTTEITEKTPFRQLATRNTAHRVFIKTVVNFYDSKRFFSPKFLVYFRLKKTDIVDFETKIC